MPEPNYNFDLINIAKKGGKLPPYVTLLFHAANRGDKAALNAIISEFYPGIMEIASEIQTQYELTDCMVMEKLHESAVQTLVDFMKRHQEEGFCKFLLWAFRANMIYTLAH